MVLLRVGFTMPLLLPAARCALTAPFHPYHTIYKYIKWRSALCCTGRGLAPPRRYLALLLSGARTFLLYAQGHKSDCLADSAQIISKMSADVTAGVGGSTYRGCKQLFIYCSFLYHQEISVFSVNYSLKLML